MRVGVVAELVAFTRHPRAQLGMRVGALADDEERAGNAELARARRAAPACASGSGPSSNVSAIVRRSRDAVRRGVHGPVDRPFEATVAKKIREPDGGADRERRENERQQHASEVLRPACRVGVSRSYRDLPVLRRWLFDRLSHARTSQRAQQRPEAPGGTGSRAMRSRRRRARRRSRSRGRTASASSAIGSPATSDHTRPAARKPL